MNIFNFILIVGVNKVNVILGEDTLGLTSSNFKVKMIYIIIKSETAILKLRLGS